MHTLYLFSVFVHVLSAMTWLGGMLFLVLVIVPSVRKPELRARAPELFHVLGTRFRSVGWTALVLLVVTGVYNVLHRGYALSDFVSGRVFAGRWGASLAMKLAFVVVIFGLSGVHDFWLGPRSTRLAREGAPEEERERARKLASVLGRVTFTFALGVVAIAITLVR